MSFDLFTAIFNVIKIHHLTRLNTPDILRSSDPLMVNDERPLNGLS